jgi:hypothetical protein
VKTYIGGGGAPDSFFIGDLLGIPPL